MLEGGGAQRDAREERGGPAGRRLLGRRRRQGLRPPPYVGDFLVDVDVQVDGFLHGEALRGERGLEVHILCRDLREGVLD